MTSLARPGGNVTGSEEPASGSSVGKGFEVLKEAFPKVSRVAVLGTGKDPGGKQQMKEMEGAAQVLG